MAKTYTTVVDLAVRSPFTEAIWDAQLRDNLNNLIVPPACYTYRNSAQIIGNATFTAASFDTESFDTDSIHDNATNPTRLTITTVGMYVLVGGNYFVANGTGTRASELRRYNSASVQQQGIAYCEYNNNGGAAGVSLACSAVTFVVTSGDYFEYYVYQASGGNLNTGAASEPRLLNFSCVWVGRTS